MVPIGVAYGAFPLACLGALLALPLWIASARCALRTYEAPRHFVPAMRSMVTCYVVAVGLFVAGLLISVWRGA